jgi:transposase
MERLERKTISGKHYYYYSKWEWVDGRCRRVWQKYLGKLENIVKAVDGGDAPAYAEVFQVGLTTALWNEVNRFGIIDIIDKHCTKRNQGLSVGQYIAIAAINRAIDGNSKMAMWEWFNDTSLLRHIPEACELNLKSQRFWDHMDMISPSAAEAIWKEVVETVVEKEDVDLGNISYDGTNFYTFIDTFNVRNKTALRGKNKQGRSNLRQVSYGLFCTRDGQIPLYYDVYEGSRNDCKEFPDVVKRFSSFLKQLSSNQDAQDVNSTIIFDKGNNSDDNINLLDDLGLHFIGSVKLGEHKDLAGISNNDERFKPCYMDSLDGLKCFSFTKNVYSKDRRVVIVFNPELYKTQLLTVNSDINKAVIKIEELRERLKDRCNGLIKGGKAPTVTSVEKKCKEILRRPYLKDILTCHANQDAKGIVLEYTFNHQKKAEIMDTHLGKKLILTSRSEWSDDDVVDGYHSQYVIEHVFREMKDSGRGTWWPMCHWTDQKVDVHGLYSSLAVLIRNCMLRRVRKAGLNLSMNRLVKELEGIKEVVNIYGKGKKVRRQAVMTKMNEVQNTLVNLLEISF